MNQKAFVRALVATLAVVLVVGLVVGAYLVATGLSARPQPSRLETLAARGVRRLAIRARAGGMSNPVPASDDVIAEGREGSAQP